MLLRPASPCRRRTSGTVLWKRGSQGPSLRTGARPVVASWQRCHGLDAFSGGRRRLPLRGRTSAPPPDGCMTVEPRYLTASNATSRSVCPVWIEWPMIFSALRIRVMQRVLVEAFVVPRSGVIASGRQEVMQGLSQLCALLVVDRQRPEDCLRPDTQIREVLAHQRDRSDSGVLGEATAGTRRRGYLLCTQRFPVRAANW